MITLTPHEVFQTPRVLRRSALGAVAALLAIVALGCGMGMGDDDDDDATMGGMGAAGMTESEMPFTFHMTHYDVMGTLEDLQGFRLSEGKPFAKSPGGSVLTLGGKGAWDPVTMSASGGGDYTITDARGAMKAEGNWSATEFAEFEMVPGWMPAGTRIEGWQGPPGSASFSGFLTLKVELEGQGVGELVMWCVMPTVPRAGRAAGHQADGIALTGGDFNFTEYADNEAGAEGIMFYDRG